MSIADNTTELNVLKELINTLPEPTSATGGVNMSYGWLSAVDQDQVTIQHGLGVIPKFVGLFRGAGLRQSVISSFIYDVDKVVNKTRQLQLYGLDSNDTAFFYYNDTDGTLINYFEANTSIAILKNKGLDVYFTNDYFWVAFADELQ